MRELKFRVWDNSDEEWSSVSPHIGYSHNKGYFELEGSKYQRDNCIIQQYTGLKDSKGVEIYEGDILVEKHDGGEGEAYIGAVSFMAGTFMIDEDSLYNYVYSNTPDVLEDFTVEGNIFENPELLKQ